MKAAGAYDVAVYIAAWLDSELMLCAPDETLWIRPGVLRILGARSMGPHDCLENTRGTENPRGP